MEILEVPSTPTLEGFARKLTRIVSTKIGQQVEAMDYYMIPTSRRAIYSNVRASMISSISDIHYGHYIAALYDNFLVGINNIFMQVPFKYSVP